MNKIQRVSLFLRIFFQIALLIWPILLIIYWSFASTLIPKADFLSLIPSHLEILHPITSKDAFLGFVIGLLPLTIEMTIFYLLSKLFKLYEQGKIFTLRNVKYIKNIGITMLIGQLVQFIYEGLISFALTYHNPSGHKVALFTFGNYDAYNIVTAVMIIVISWIMAEGCKLQEESKYTV